MSSLPGLLAALIAALAFGPVVGWLVDKADAPTRPVTIDAVIWAQIIDTSRAGRWIGLLERLLFVGAFWTGHVEIVAGRLTFKLASKWEVWRNVVRVTESIDAVAPLEWFAVRSKFGSWMLSKFWIGTLGNVVASLAASALGRALEPLLASRFT